VCTRICDPAQGVFDNAACPAGTACSSAGYCEPTAVASAGAQQLGQACSRTNPDGFCDGSKKLVCVESSTCELGCHPAQSTTTAACGTGQTCMGSWLSPTGGYCL